MNDDALSRDVETKALGYYVAYNDSGMATVDVFDRWQEMMNACAALIEARKSDPVETALARLDGSGSPEPWREPK